MKHRHCQQGLTLLETLVTLVIVSMVAGLMSEGMYQLGRVEQRLGTGQMQARLDRLHLVWVRQALEGLIPSARDAADGFQGGARTLRGLSGMLPQPEPMGPMPMQLSLSYRAEAGLTELTMTANYDGAGTKPVVLARWHGDAGRFSYQDENGEWRSDWPPAGTLGAVLPRAIAIQRDGEQVLLVVAPQASAEALGIRVDLNKLP